MRESSAFRLYIDGFFFSFSRESLTSVFMLIALKTIKVNKNHQQNNGEQNSVPKKKAKD